MEDRRGGEEIPSPSRGAYLPPEQKTTPISAEELPLAWMGRAREGKASA